MLPSRRSIRLEGRDYGAHGSYFITICTHQRRCNLSRLDDRGLRLSKFGKVIEGAWDETLRKRSYLRCREFVIMPNHVHGLFSIFRNNEEDRARHALPLHGQQHFQKLAPESVPTIVGALKSAVTKEVNALRGTPGAKFWQRGYYEHVIRDEEDREAIAHYIRENPDRWLLDRENPDGTPDKAEEDFWHHRLKLRV